MHQKKYGLCTAITIIVGIVIGSGIFFKSDDILVKTNGSIILGVLAFCLAAISIIFGSLTIAQLASKNDEAGGIITYAEDNCNKSIASGFGWFHTFLYYPSLIAVVAWVVGIYACMLFGIEGTLENQILIGFGAYILLYILNFISAKLGGYFQNASTFIKLIPLILIAIVGLIFGDPSSVSIGDIGNSFSAGSFTWLAAIVPIAFAFDGWIISTSIAHEIKDSKRNLPLALIIAPVAILIVYVLYFVGISSLVGPQNVMSMGDDHVNKAAISIFGEWGAKAILVFVIISVMGTVNGLTLGMMRLPYSLSLKEMFFAPKTFSKLNQKSGISAPSAILCFFVTAVWFLLHYLTTKFGWLGSNDVSEISIVMNYVAYIILYVQVFKLYARKEIKGIFKGVIFPILAILGSLLVLAAGLINPKFIIFASISVITFLIGSLFWIFKSKKLAVK